MPGLETERERENKKDVLFDSSKLSSVFCVCVFLGMHVVCCESFLSFSFLFSLFICGVFFFLIMGKGR